MRNLVKNFVKNLIKNFVKNLIKYFVKYFVNYFVNNLVKYFVNYLVKPFDRLHFNNYKRDDTTRDFNIFSKIEGEEEVLILILGMYMVCKKKAK